MKILVTHLSPDLDALCACWLIKRFLPGWEKAEIKYVPAGLTLDNQPVDESKKIIHVDTGLGKFDHHQTNDFTCSTKLVLDFLIKKNHITSQNIQSLIRLTNFVNEIDHFYQAFYPDPTADYYDFCLHQIVESLKSVTNRMDKVEEIVLMLLDSELLLFKNKLAAEEEIKKGFIFQSLWGKTIVMESRNNEVLNLALKMKFHLAVKKDPEKGNIRIKTMPGEKYDLTPLWEKIIKNDKVGTWFLHVSKNMLLNGSAKSSRFIPSPLTLKRLIEIIKSV